MKSNTRIYFVPLRVQSQNSFFAKIESLIAQNFV